MTTQQATLICLDAEEYSRFGCRVAANGNTAVIGAPHADGAGGDSGSAYVYGLPCLSHTQEPGASDGWDDSQAPGSGDGQPDDPSMPPTAPMCGVAAAQAMLPSMLTLLLMGFWRRR